MKTKKLRRALGIVIAAVMVFAMVPAMAMAEGISSTVKIVWDDNYDAQEARPAAVKAILSDGTQFVLNAENNWEFTRTDLPEGEGGYRWTLYESDLPDGYEVTKTETEGTATTFTISYTASAPGGDTNVISYDLWVNGQQVSEYNKNEILKDDNGNATAYFTVGEDDDGNETFTLTLDGAEITAGHEEAGVYSDGINLTVVLKGENNTIKNGLERGIRVKNGSLTIKDGGEGKLDIDVSGYAAINAADDIKIESGNITAISGIVGISSSNGGIEISGGILDITGNRQRGIYAKGDIKITGGDVKAKAGDAMQGIYSVKNIEISGADTVVYAKTEKGLYAIYAQEGITYKPLAVTLPEGGEAKKIIEDWTIADSNNNYATEVRIEAPVTAYDLWVNGIQVTEKNAENIPVDSGTAVYNHEENTLTLTDAEITKGYKYKEGYVYKAGIYANTDLKIVLVGENKITLTESNSYGITVEEGKTLTITGEGSLETEGFGNGICNYNANLKIESGTVTARGNGNGIDSTEGSITVTGGRLEAKSTGGYWAIDLTDGNISYPYGYLAEPAGGGLNEHEDFFVDKDGNLAKKVVIEEPIEKYELWVNGEQVTEKNASEIPVDKGTAVYNHEEKTLTLTNAEITKGYEYQEGWVITAGIYANTDLTMVLVGENKITLTESNSYGITVEEGNTLTIRGEGSLETEGWANGIYNGRANLKIESGTVTAKGGGYGIYSTEGSITVTGGSLTAQSTGSGKAIKLTERNISYPEGYLVDPADGGLNEDGYFVDKDGNAVSKVVIEKPVEKYDLWVNGEQVTEKNAENILGDEEETHTAVYDPKTKTLTLTNAEITEGYGLNNMTAGIFADGFDLTIDVEGNNNKITGTAAGICVTGGGLVISTDDAGILNISEVDMCGVSTDKDFSVKEAIINVTSEGEGIYAEGNIKIEDGSMVIATSTGSESIFAAGKLSVAGDETYVVLKGSEEDGAITAGGGIELGNHLGVSKPEGGAVSNDGTCIVDNKGNKAAEVTIERLYTVTIEETVNGKAEASLEKAPSTAEVTIKTTPASGYKLDKITATDSEGKEVTVTDGKFKMPESDVTVSVTFKKGSSGGGGGGGGSHTKYPVEIKNPKNGTVTVSPEEARNGDKVKIFAVPDPGFEVSEIIVTNKDGSAISVKNTNDGGFMFVMSDSKAKVEVKFKEIEDGVSPETPEDAGAPLMTIKIGSTKYQLNGADMEMDSAPFIDENDRTMLPVRVVANALGISDADIAWDNETKTASFTRPDGKVVSCTVGSNIIKIGDEEIETDTAPVIRNDRIYLPMRALFNAFNVSDAHIIWNGVNKTVTVTKEALEDIKALAEPVEEAEETA
ncbi:MAG: carbohydrate-binding domain-containing protein [Firmicutes bacterium]|nr:carbohydrate-binding domain-containing protein [Bacillota bacterium]